jgi:chorismate synthase
LRYLTAGESHGKALVGIIDGYPSGVPVDIDFINKELARRQKGTGRGGRMAIESDEVEIISGIRKSYSIGSPISFLIHNKDWVNWKDIMNISQDGSCENKEKILLNPRPGHADLTGFLKYRFNNIRDVIERSSARETAARVCVGGFAKIALNLFGIKIYSYVTRIGPVSFEDKIKLEKETVKKIEESAVRCPDEKISNKMEKEILKSKAHGDSLGGKFKVIAVGAPPGLGSYSQWDMRLDSRIAAAFMSIPAIKAVDIGNGFSSASVSGRNFHDEIYYDEKNGFFRKTNRAGGIEGGMTNGGNIVVGAVMKPIPTTRKGLGTVNIQTKKAEVSLKERADICAVPAASVVGEAVLSIEILNAMQEKFGKDNMDEILENYTSYKKYIKNIEKL